MNSQVAAQQSTSTVSTVLPNNAVAGQIYTITGAAGLNGSNYSGISTSVYNGTSWITPHNTSSTISSLSGSIVLNSSSNNKEIVRLNADGSVQWNDNVDVDDAAKAFGESLKIGAEMAAGITESVKRSIRDTIFEEMIEIAKEKGSLTPDELTYMYKATKIMDKLKGAK